MNKRFLVILLPLLLASCDLTSGSSQQQSSGNSEQTSQTETEGEKQEQENQQEHQEEQHQEEHHEEQHQEEHHEEQTGGDEGNTEEKQGISLDEWHNYYFHDGHYFCYDPDWDFYYGTTYEPISSCKYENPNEDLDYSGIKFYDKKQYLVSPTFNCYPKIEMRITFWFSSKTTSDYKATENEPQFKIEEYNSSNKLINTDKIEIARSNVPHDNTAYVKKIYITQNAMTHFHIRFNNFVPNGGSGYMPVICEIGLKGWPRV